MISIEQVLETARLSECVRRKYGAVVVNAYEAPDYIQTGKVLSMGYNKRVGACCNGECIRNTLNAGHGSNTDAGAEIHAEQAALVWLDPNWRHMAIYVAGINYDGKPMNGFDNSPCYSCARMIKFAGISDVYLPIDGEWEKFDIEDIMETWEKSWE